MSIDLARSYDAYYNSHLYDQRYPHHNPHCLALIIEQIRQQGNKVLDFGCGNGRYTAPLLAQTPANVTAYDICHEAIRELSERQAPYIASQRLQPVVGDLDALRAASGGQFDLALMMFGVLGHIYPKENRMEVLRTVHALLRPGGRLIVTVPSAVRRFHQEQAAARAQGLDAGDIFYKRQTPTTVIDMYYHLYTVEEFRHELESAGLKVVNMSAESLFPESAVVKSSIVSHLDRWLGALLPLRYAYGFLAVVEA